MAKIHAYTVDVREAALVTYVIKSSKPLTEQQVRWIVKNHYDEADKEAQSLGVTEVWEDGVEWDGVLREPEITCTEEY